MFDHEHERSHYLARVAELEKAEREQLEENHRRKRRQRDENAAYQQQQIAYLLHKSDLYKLLYRSWSLFATSMSTARHSLGVVMKILPPVNTLISGMIAMLDLVEAIFISRETRNRRAVKITNSILGTGLSIASTALLFNPATAPLGSILTTVAMSLAILKEAFFWYQTNKDYQAIKLRMREDRRKLNQQTKAFVKSHCKIEIVKIKKLYQQITELDNINRQSPEQRSSLIQLKQQKQTLIRRINYEVNQQLNFVTARYKMTNLKKDVARLRKNNHNQQRNFALSFGSFIGTALLSAATVMVAAGILIHPLALGILGITVLGAITVTAIAQKVAPILAHKRNPASKKKIKHDPYMNHLGDTEIIVRKLAHNVKPLEIQILQSDIADYRAQSPTAMESLLIMPEAALDQPQFDLNPQDSEGENENPHLGGHSV